MQKRLVAAENVRQDSSEIRRKAYRAPVLTQFGAIRHLTQGADSMGSYDGNSGMVMTA